MIGNSSRIVLGSRRGTVRVLAGAAKGAKLRAPVGRQRARPTSSRVRSAIFNMVPRGRIEGRRVLDAYAGTGSLGIEALSHGATWVDFVEKDRALCQCIRDNVEASGFTRQSHIYCANTRRALEFLRNPYDLVLMDPPYADDGLEDTASGLDRSGLLSSSAWVVIEHAARVAMPERIGQLAMLKGRRYGDSAVSLYVRETAA